MAYAALALVFPLVWVWSAVAFGSGLLGRETFGRRAAVVGGPVTTAGAGLILWAVVANAPEAPAVALIGLPTIGGPALWFTGRLGLGAACWAVLAFVAPLAAGAAGPLIAVPLAIGTGMLASTRRAPSSQSRASQQ